MARVAAMGRGVPRGGSPAASPAEVVPTHPAFYARHSTTLALALLAVIALRLHEFHPLAAALRPALLLSLVGAYMVLTGTHASVLESISKHPAGRAALVYFGIAIVGIPFSLWPGLSFDTVKGLFACIVLFFAVALCRPTRDVLDRLQVGFVVMVAFYAVYAQLFGSSWMGRLEIGGMYDSNDMAALLSIGFPLAAGLVIRETGQRRWLAVAAAAALLMGIVATGSRGGTLGLLAGALVFVLGMRGPRRIGVMLLFVAAGTVLWTTSSATFQSRIRSLTNLENDFNMTSPIGRKQVWARGRQYVIANPILGVGAGNFPTAEGQSLAQSGETGKWSAAHNAYIQAYAETGLIGGTAFVAFLLLPVVRTRQLFRGIRPPGRPEFHRPEFAAAAAAFAAAGYFLSHAYYPPAFAVVGFLVLADRTFRAEASGRPAVTRTVAAPPEGQRGGLATGRFRPGPAIPG